MERNSPTLSARGWNAKPTKWSKLLISLYQSSYTCKPLSIRHHSTLGKGGNNPPFPQSNDSFFFVSESLRMRVSGVVTGFPPFHYQPLYFSFLTKPQLIAEQSWHFFLRRATDRRATYKYPSLHTITCGKPCLCTNTAPAFFCHVRREL